jgi:type IV secretion system protein VirB1
VLPNMDVMDCQGLAVPAIVMQHVVDVESSFNRYAIGVVGARLARQPANLDEAVATARMLDSRGYNFSLGLAQVNRSNLARYGLLSYAQAFDACRNLRVGSRILAECHARAGNDWGRALSCYYSGDFVTGFRQGYVAKVFASMGAGPGVAGQSPLRTIDIADRLARSPLATLVQQRIERTARGLGLAADANPPPTVQPPTAVAGSAPVVVTLGGSSVAPLPLPAQAPGLPAMPPAVVTAVAAGDQAFVF